MSMSSIYPTQFNGKKSEKIPYEKFKNLEEITKKNTWNNINNKIIEIIDGN